MLESSLRWRLEGGYSQILDQARVEVTLVEGPASQKLKLKPFGLFKEPTQLIFRVVDGVRASGPGNLRWRIRPGGELRAVVLQPRNAYLGNFRVPAGQFAIQWDVEADVTSTVLSRFSNLLVAAEAGSTLVHSWVTLFPLEISLKSAILQSWQAFIDPFDPEEVLRLAERQVVRFRWSGRLNASMGVEWGIGVGWTVKPSGALLALQTDLKSAARLRAGLEISKRGSFLLRLLKRHGQIQLSVTEDRALKQKGELSVRAALSDKVKLKPQWKSAEPLLEPLNDQLTKAIGRRAEIAFVLESERWRRRHALLKAAWKNRENHHFSDEYRQLIAGFLPAQRPGLQISGRIETVRGKRLTVLFNILNWIRLGRASEQKNFYRVNLGPAGELTVEEGTLVEKTSYRWDELQFVSLLCSQKSTENSSIVSFIWTFQKKRKFERADLVRLLKRALCLRSISSFDLPGSGQFPIFLDICWCTELTQAGVEAIKRSSRQDKWEALVDALEIAEPRYYDGSGFMRDWIVSSEVRDMINLNPVQSHLKSIYPLAGRTDFQRRQVVASYQKVKKFLRLIELWERGEERKLMDSLNLGWELPLFFWFHLLCPEELRKTAVILTGDLHRVWGNTELIAELS